MQNTYEESKLISLLQDRVQTYFQNKENRKKFENGTKKNTESRMSGGSQMKIEGVKISLVKHYEVGDVLDFQQERKEHIKVLLVDRKPDGMFVGFSVDCLSELRPMNEEDSNRGGYDASDLSKYLNSKEFMNILPDKLRDRVEAVRIPFVEEMFGSDDDYEDINVTVKQLELMKARRNRIAFQGCDSNNWCWYWMMNRRKDSAAYFAGVSGNGICYCSLASNANGVRPVFLLNL